MIPFTDPDTGLRDYRAHASGTTPRRWPWLVLVLIVVVFVRGFLTYGVPR